MLIGLQGRPGCGKSTLASTMCNLGFNVHYIDMDAKVKTLANLQHFVKDGKITFIECPEPLNVRKLGQVARQSVKESFPKMQPKGYIWLCDYIDDLEKNIEDLDLDPQHVVPVIDSMSAVNRHLKQLIRYYVKGPKPGFDGWDTILQNYESFFDDLKSLTPEPFPHVIITLHTRDDFIRDGEASIVECRPFLDGQFREALAGYFEEFYFLEVETIGKTGRPKYWAYTKPVGPIKHARSGMVQMTRIESDFVKIFDEAGKDREE